LDNQQRSSEQENVQRSSLRRGVGKLFIPEMAGLRKCVYCLIDSSNNRIRYIGKTECALSKRLREHLQDSRRHNTKVSRWVHNRIDNGYDIIMRPLICDVDLNVWEKRFIKIFKHKNFKLLNMTDGGGGVLGTKQTEETKIKKSLALSGKKKSPEHIDKMRKAFSKTAFVYNAVNGKFVGEYSSFKQASKDLIVNHTGLLLSAKYGRHVKNYRAFYTYQGNVIPVKPKYYKKTSIEKYINEEDMIQAP